MIHQAPVWSSAPYWFLFCPHFPSSSSIQTSGPLAVCLESQQLGSVPLSSDSNAEIEYWPWAKGWGIEYAYMWCIIWHLATPSILPAHHLPSGACISIRLREQMTLLELDPTSPCFSHTRLLRIPWEFYDSQFLITFRSSWLKMMGSTFSTG